MGAPRALCVGMLVALPDIPNGGAVAAFVYSCRAAHGQAAYVRAASET